MYVKICGIDSDASALIAIEAGADAIGVVMNQTSERRLDFKTAERIIRSVSNAVDTVLVVNDMTAHEAAHTANRLGVTALQLHGPKYTSSDFTEAISIHPVVWRATSLSHSSNVTTGAFGEQALLLDSHSAGSGKRWDLTPLKNNPPQGKWLIAGGLNPENVSEVINTIRPWGVDVSSGVESSPGIKDHRLIIEFVNAARKTPK